MPAALNILVVEDNLDSQQMVCELIGAMGHAASGASDGELAWEMIGAQHFDVLLTDVSLPGMSGIELARKALRRQPTMRVIFSTGYGEESLDAAGVTATLLCKPYELADLTAALGGPA
jgi:CheY-like chemotaxis protein